MDMTSIQELQELGHEEVTFEAVGFCCSGHCNASFEADEAEE